MKSETDNLNKVERYLREEMDPEEKTAFEKRLENDPALVEEFNLTKSIMANTIQQGDDDLRRQIARVHEKMKAEGVVRPYSGRKQPGAFIKRLLPAAAAAAAAVLLLVIFLPDNAPVANELYSELFQTYFEPDTEPIDPLRDELLAMGLAANDQEKNEELAAALALYGEGKHATADEALKKFTQTYPEDQTGKYYLALLDIQMERWAEGIDKLESLSRVKTIISKEKIQWYLALSYLRTNQTDQAKEIFEDLEKGHSDISKKAKLLLDDWE